ncbi:type IV secretion system protein [Agrobacterium vitis]|uniref:type IV secretion system protein n=1 Tax=Allorhizobium ampelinum TaxID=3025782 RepID=UPI001F19414A|nr:type IV secretion system protein [Allorhizobium ampelinum]MCF1450523.1 type IV secretion system protein [Allorhizobium ampelinum]
MSNFIGDIVTSIDKMGTNFSQQAYTTLGNEIVPVLNTCFTLYVAVYGLQLMLGATTISGREIVIRVAKMAFILGLVQSWSTFNTLFYAWLNSSPEKIGMVILTAGSTGVSDVTDGLSAIWDTANEVASAFAKQSGYWTVLPALIGILVMVGAGLLVAVALALIMISKVMVWVLVASAPIFIACMLFDRTKGLGNSWFQQVLLYALIQLFVYIVAAMIISLLKQEMSLLGSSASNSTIQLSDIASFVLLTIAGVFVLLNVQSLAQGIAGGLSISAGGFANSVMGGGWSLGKISMKGAIGSGRLGKNAVGAARRRFGSGDGGSIGPSAALQTRIQNQSLPR